MKLFSIIILIGLSLTFMSSCSSAVKKVKSQPISIGFASWPGFDVIYYAKTTKMFEKYNLEVKLVEFSNQEAATKALDDLEVDAVMTSIWDVQHLQGNNDFDVILVTNISNGADGIVAVKDITSLSQLKNKKISAQSNSVNELILLEALHLHKMKTKDVVTLDMTNEKAMAKLFHEEIQAAVLWEPLLSLTQRKIDGNILFTTKEVDSMVIDLLVVHSESIQKQPKQWKDFLLVWFDLMQVLEDEPHKVLDLVGRHIENPFFSSDYAGLKAGTFALNNRMFTDNHLSDSLDKVTEMVDTQNKARIHVNKEFTKDVMKQWMNSYTQK
ncbi:ABC transporter substrate-binding protein [Sulfurimonas sp. MAG313]|nr:ABC transporter substrate-binding protein [Sulfurimonas sp. MAG313]MDF1880368.1 ABC transporter substrate-binding protein [Sulfurimonas sp. MAG313]